MLLADRPANGSELVTLLARVRFVLTAESLDIDDPSLEIYLKALLKSYSSDRFSPETAGR